MFGSEPSGVLHLIGFSTGAVLYGMLLALLVRDRSERRPDRFALATATLGMVWNLAELLALLAGPAWRGVAPWMHALGFTALGGLGAVVVHSALRPGPEGAARLTRWLVPLVVYLGATVAGVMHVSAAAAGGVVPSLPGLVGLTLSFVVTLPVLAGVGGVQRAWHPAWFGAVAVFAASAVHLGQLHGSEETWPIEVVGHHASMLLAFALLYQDYRFAFADLFLKNALTLLALVALISAGYALVAPQLFDRVGGPSTSVVGLLLTLWASTAVAFPWLRRALGAFVDRVLLKRPDSAAFVAEVDRVLQSTQTVTDAMDCVAGMMAKALTASAVTWFEHDAPTVSPGAQTTVPVPTSESPTYSFAVARLAGGRRLLSDDTIMLERAAMLVARRIDLLRLMDERYQRMLEEREMRGLATEAELRALRAQINPHFLFNALTTIGYLIQHAPTRAFNALMRLTTLLRSVLRPEGEFTTLRRECDLVKCYLEIERERFEDRLTFTLDVPEALAELVIPSLILQPLVENAVKHGVATARQGGTVSMVAQDDDGLRVIVRNTGMALAGGGGSAGFGVGLSNVERRLRHHYGAAASVTLFEDAEGATVAELRLPLQPATVGDEVGVVEAAPR